jgi:hypothetical protein
MIITIDTHGNNMTQNVKEQVTARKEKIMAEMEG